MAAAAQSEGRQGPLDAEFTATMVRSPAEGGWIYVQLLQFNGVAAPH